MGERGLHLHQSQREAGEGGSKQSMRCWAALPTQRRTLVSVAGPVEWNE